jgi:hypothetical protein
MLQCDWLIGFRKNNGLEIFQQMMHGYDDVRTAIKRLRETYPKDDIFIEEFEQIQPYMESITNSLKAYITEFQLGGSSYGTPTILRRNLKSKWAVRVHRAGCLHYLNPETLEWDSDCVEDFQSDYYYLFGLEEAYKIAQKKLKSELPSLCE